ncbi:MAG: NUDIX domain-containing protein [Dehalococcoidales bacterium]|nr:NUDIX domain-containing protein [Dehalococcoidales bacterium]
MLPEKHVVTCFLESDDKILILRRSEKVGTYRWRWAGVSGYVETTPDEQALIEIREETGLLDTEVVLRKKGEPLVFDDEQLGVRWVIYPYLFHIKVHKQISIDWEHKEYQWIKPAELANYETVPKYIEVLSRVLP